MAVPYMMHIFNNIALNKSPTLFWTLIIEHNVTKTLFHCRQWFWCMSATENGLGIQGREHLSYSWFCFTAIPNILKLGRVPTGKIKYPEPSLSIFYAFEVLEEKNKLMEKNIRFDESKKPPLIAELEAKCMELKQQVYEMEVLCISILCFSFVDLISKLCVIITSIRIFSSFLLKQGLLVEHYCNGLNFLSHSRLNCQWKYLIFSISLYCLQM